MIGHIEHGSNFGGLFRYLLATDKGARIIGGNAAGDTIEQLTQEFNNCADQRRTTTKPVKHFILSFAPEDGEVEDDLKQEIATQAIQRLGYVDNQYVVIEHQRQDPGHDWNHDHDHIHIAVNMITLEGQRVDDWQDKRRFEAIIRELEQEHQLTQVAPSRERKQKALTHGQVQKYKRQLRDYQTGLQPQTPDIPISIKLQAAIDAVTRDKPTMTLFIGRLQHLGIDVKPIITATGRKRISYHIDGAKPFRGSKLHNGSFPKLISQRGVNCDPQRDRKAMESAVNHQQVTLPTEQLINWSEINLSLYLPKELDTESLGKEKQKKNQLSLNNEPKSCKNNQHIRVLINENKTEDLSHKENEIRKEPLLKINQSQESSDNKEEALINQSKLNTVNTSLETLDKENTLINQSKLNTLNTSSETLDKEKALMNPLPLTPEFCFDVIEKQLEYTLTIAPIAYRWLKANQTVRYSAKDNLIEYSQGRLTIRNGEGNYKMIAQAVGFDEQNFQQWQCINLPQNSPGLTQKDVETFTGSKMKDALRELEQKTNQFIKRRKGRRGR
ncbi:relaxase/mobilization nuclease domain-containing protein [Crocosphaera sp. Alani8]|uniref:relaxase/mobilization nuclease domain-containing protein n=1 Tax=Crocosphaera sp. Alani8 TaxID=3038952 RepID=UPI00313F1BCE